MNKPLQLLGIIALVFGILVIVWPQLLNTLVGIFFIVVGLNLLILNRNIR